MAVTKIHPIKSTLKKALDYICDAKKTDDNLLVSSFACTPETADIEFEFTRKQARNKSEVVLARHLIQAFEPGEVTPEQAHELGKQFADEVLGGKYEYVLTTHIDKDHVHNHIIFNNVDLIEHMRYDSNKKSYHQLRRISDRLCKENGLSVIKDPVAKNVSRAEYEKGKRGESWKALLKKEIDAQIKTAKSFDGFLEQMKKGGYQIKQGKYIAFKGAGQERFARAKTLGEAYAEDAIKKRIAEQGRAKKRNAIYRPNILKIGLLTNLKAHVAAKSYGRDQWVKLRNLKESANMLNFLTAQGITSRAQLEQKTAEIQKGYEAVGQTIKAAEQKLRGMSEVLSDLTKYQQLKPIGDVYKKAANKTKFYAVHESNLILFEAAERSLAQKGINPEIDIGQLKANYKNLETQRVQLYADYRSARGKLENFKNAKENMEKILTAPKKEKTKQRVTKKEVDLPVAF